jgi:hypothetical protein
MAPKLAVGDQPKYPKATECLAKDKDWLFTFYDFSAPALVAISPADPWEDFDQRGTL